MPRLQVKTFDAPDERRVFPLGHAEVVALDEATVGRSQWEPGWRWTTHLAPVAGTASCQVHHLGLSVSGRLRVETDDGASIDIPPDSIYEIPPGHDAWVVGEEPWVTVEWTSARIVGVAPEGPGERVLATVLFTDIVDSTASLQRLGDDAWRDLLLRHNARLRDDLNTFRGREVTTTGDGFLAVFDGATRAVRCGVAMARSAGEIGVPIRVGVHTGEVEFVGGNVRGVAVHAAARVMSLAGPNEVFVSATTSDLLEGSGITLENAGSHEMKGLAGRRQVFRVAVQPVAT
jgi:class 3 adenylate cyclase